jgi:putative flippase GtrA
MKQSLLEQKVGVSHSLDTQEVTPAARLASYRPTQWTFLNRVLDIVDDVTGGRAGWCQRFFTFAFIGGIGALINMAVFYIVFDIVAQPANETVRNVVASVFAAEISIMANFMLNDFFTFRHLPGHQRTWLARCMRFHVTAIGGTVLTFLIEFSTSHLLHVRPIYAQAIALIIVLFYNFSFHHLFTYRHVKPSTGQA